MAAPNQMRKRKVAGGDRRILLSPADIEVGTERIAGLPVVNTVLDRLGFHNLVAACLPEPDPRRQIEPARAIGLLVPNLALGRRPLYGLGEWASSFDPELLGLNAAVPQTLSDD